MCRRRIAAAFLLLGLGCAAQQGGGRGARPAADPAAAPIVRDLYRQARASIAALPEAAEPQLMADVAREEMRLDPADGADDYTAAFNLARALEPPASDTDTAGQAREQVKQFIEAEAVGGLARLQPEDALELARLADVPKGPLYDQLIMAAAPRGGRGRGSAESSLAKPAASSQPAAEAAPKLADTVFGLVQECEEADGTYPYRGVAAVLGRLEPLDRISLVRDAYRWAGNETDPAAMTNSVALFRAGQRYVPELDGALESSLVSQLQTLGQGANAATAPFGAGSNPGNLLMSLLTGVDPPRAEALAASFPNLGSQAISSFNLGGASGSAAGSNPSLSFSFSLPAVPGLGGMASGNMDEGGGSAGQAATSAFEELVAQAESLRRRDPGSSLGAANQAADLLDGPQAGALWASATDSAASLAQLYFQLGDSGDAARLLSRCLDAADQQARDLDASYQAADPDQQAQMAQTLASPQSQALEVYSLAARLDLASTAARAEAAQFVLLKPAILLRVALVAGVGPN